MNVVLSEKKGAVLHLRLNRPEKANALSKELVENLLRELKNGAASKEIRVVTLSGTGKTFCAGADKDELSGSVEGPQKTVETYVELMGAISALEKPFLVGVNGPAVGGGLGLAAIGDIVLASENAFFRTPELKLGLFPFVISPILVPIIGRKRFFEMVYTAEPVSAKTAREWGLVSRVYPQASLGKELEDLAASVSQAPGALLFRGKRAIMQGLDFQQMGRELQTLISQRGSGRS